MGAYKLTSFHTSDTKMGHHTHPNYMGGEVHAKLSPSKMSPEIHWSKEFQALTFKVTFSELIHWPNDKVSKSSLNVYEHGKNFNYLIKKKGNQLRNIKI